MLERAVFVYVLVFFMCVFACVANVHAYNSSQIFYVAYEEITSELLWTSKGGPDYLCCKQGGEALRILSKADNTSLEMFIDGIEITEGGFYIGAGLAPEKSKGWYWMGEGWTTDNAVEFFTEYWNNGSTVGFSNWGVNRLPLPTEQYAESDAVIFDTIISTWRPVKQREKYAVLCSQTNNRKILDLCAAPTTTSTSTSTSSTSSSSTEEPIHNTSNEKQFPWYAILIIVVAVELIIFAIVFIVLCCRSKSLHKNLDKQVGASEYHDVDEGAAIYRSESTVKENDDKYEMKAIDTYSNTQHDEGSTRVKSSNNITGNHQDNKENNNNNNSYSNNKNQSQLGESSIKEVTNPLKDTRRRW